MSPEEESEVGRVEPCFIAIGIVGLLLLVPAVWGCAQFYRLVFEDFFGIGALN